MQTRSYRATTPLRYDAIETAGGPVTFATDGEAIREIRLGRRLRDRGRKTPLDRETARQLRDYFHGARTTFDLPIRFAGTRFEEDVWHAVHAIPFGDTFSYSEIAATVGRPRAARAVGNAVGANPLPLFVPCHRVLAMNGRLGGFGCGLDWKRFLLRLEGVAWK